ncbi:ABC transporter ATP-binding protein [Clostridium autoethanogenum]|uniref:ABC transporter ATP-binding protein n=1 Tax=Clostridium autoethanogenum DSM 10061 TaxID=1341692 RepID=A0ABN4BJ10_9CLOT|nr:ABC transporter ATP-binding protein [Clostridium autoethanogenum]AGY77718.1 ABC transporter ATP-binding protein [Clostridium autoethanogenum DSM 10061]ALU37856.1 ABC-type transporter related protein [Clostridium autoethanogenum DSM 10061]OVY49793.1 Bacitracin export ATP-binding protein BceA [Clostridium autoethanogenum]
MSTVIETKNLGKIYGSKAVAFTALHGINLKVDEGEFLGIMGPSGAGKTTLLNLLSTIDVPTTGNIIFNGKDITKLKNKELSLFRRDKIGFIFQDFNLLDTMTVEDNIALPLALSKVNHKEIQNKVKQLSEFFGIDKHLKNYPYELSGGQKQRTAAARALITEPSVIFADEPTGALDSKSSAELLQCLSSMNERFNKTVIMVTHDAFAASYCRRILFIKDGKIHARIDKNESRKEFFQRIIEMLAALGGAVNELL